MSYHTIQEAREVLAETARIMAQAQERKAAPVAAVAHAKVAGSPKPTAPAETATSRWTAAVAEKVKTGLPKAKALRAVAIEDPQLHRDYLAEFNAKATEVTRLDRSRAEIARQIARR